MIHTAYGGHTRLDEFCKAIRKLIYYIQATPYIPAEQFIEKQSDSSSCLVRPKFALLKSFPENCLENARSFHL